MSDSLYATKTRVALLRDVLAGDVVEGPDEHGTIWTWLIDPPYAPRKVSSRIRELRAAGWVEQVGIEWYLTAAGIAVLDAAEVKS